MLTLLGEDVRVKITADINFFVATTGSNSNNGLSSGSAWLTLQFAIDYIRAHYDLSTFDCYINVGAGSFAGVDIEGGFVGGRTVEITGAGSASTTVNNVDIGTGNVPDIIFTPVLNVNALKLGNAALRCIGLTNWGYGARKTSADLVFDGSIGGGSDYALQVYGTGAFAAVQANFKNGFVSLCDLDQNSQVFAHNCAVDGTTAVGIAVITLDLNSTFTIDGTFGGGPISGAKRFSALGNSVIRGTSASATDLPGTVDGILTQGSVYIPLKATLNVAPSSGGTTSIALLIPNILFVGGSVLGSQTVNLPPSPGTANDMMISTIAAPGSNGVTALTIATTDGSTVFNAPTTLAAGQIIAMQFHSTSAAWYRLV